MNGENQLLVADEPVEFERYPTEVQVFGKIINHLRKNLENIPQINEETPIDVNM